MKSTKFVRGLSMALALILLCAALPFGTLAAGILELVATDVSLDETHFEYTGEEIRPNVTVRVKDTLLTLDKDYTLEYRNNVEIGEAAVVVTGIATSGYMGTVEHPFYIDPRTSDDNQPDLITIIGTDVVIDGTEFTATGEAIEPAVTVTVAGQELTAGEDYTLVYENNVEPGTGSVTVTGVADKGYTGSVTIHFTILAAAETPTEPEETQPEETQPEETQPEETQPEETQPEDTQPEETQPEETQPEETKPEETQPEETQPEETQPEDTQPEETKPEDTQPEETKPEDTQPEETKPEETRPVSYKITKGNGGRWHKDSGKSLSFTSDGAYADFISLLVDGKTVNSKYYTVKEGSTVITLKETFLQHLELGKHTITMKFEDGEAEGTFRILEPMDDSNPKTGDDFALHAWTALLFVSLTGIIGAAFACRKKFRK